MLRTPPPPDGMIQVWNFSLAGSNRTTVFLVAPALAWLPGEEIVEAFPPLRLALVCERPPHRGALTHPVAVVIDPRKGARVDAVALHPGRRA